LWCACCLPLAFGAWTTGPVLIRPAMLGCTVFLDLLELPRDVRAFLALGSVRFWWRKFRKIIDGRRGKLKSNQPVLILYHSKASSNSSSELSPLLYRDVSMSLPQVS
jgi:hypothetical protein